VARSHARSMSLTTWARTLICAIVSVFSVMAQQAFTIPPASQLVETAVSTSSNPAPAWIRPVAHGSSGSLYRWSVAAVLAANAGDVATSWRNREANPLIAGPSTQFGLTSVAIKSGLVGTSLLIQHVMLRHRPELAKRLAWMNFVTSGALGGVAAHNASLR
jgi:hypothetical protein